MATISNTPRPGYVWDVTDNVWYPIGVGGHSHSEIASTIADAKGDLIAGTAADTVSRLAVGTNGQYLKADSTAGTGLAWATLPSSGKVLQVVQATTSTQVINNTSTLADTGLTASITPSSATSTILVMVSQMGCMKTAAASTNSINLRLYRGATDIAKIAGGGLDTATSLQQMASFTYSFIDSPATTSSTTYKTQFNNINNGASVRVQQEGEKSTIILMEIGA